MDKKPEPVSDVLKRMRVKPAHIPAPEWEQMKAEALEKERLNDERLRGARMRGLAHGADNGMGICRWCQATLGEMLVDGVTHKTHPLDEHGLTQCPGPPHRCDVDGTEYRGHGGCPTCAERHAGELREQHRKPPAPPPEMKPLGRARRDIDEVDD